MLRNILNFPIRSFAQLTNRQALNQAIDEEMAAN